MKFLNFQSPISHCTSKNICSYLYTNEDTITESMTKINSSVRNLHNGTIQFEKFTKFIQYFNNYKIHNNIHTYSTSIDYMY